MLYLLGKYCIDRFPSTDQLRCREIKCGASDQNGNLVTSQKSIAIAYLKSWLFLDAISAIPFDVISGHGLRFLRLFKVTQMGLGDSRT